MFSVSAGFWEEAERAKILVEKILKEIPVVHATTVSAEGLTLEPSNQETQLQMMMTSLGIPASPVLKPLSERFSVDMCTHRMWIGGQLHQRLLGVLSDRLSGLSDLTVDLRDLLTHITKMREGARPGAHLSDQDQTADLGLSSRLHSNYELQVAVHMTLTQLRSFCYDMIRSLREFATYRRSLATAR
ncbi:uncharacterized protein LOC103393428 isoform X2 [Cynoglossus semilaevis]|nr:uncharacterized protein LOC103393428 isoform X2 [Cynoglossus semilaevis]